MKRMLAFLLMFTTAFAQAAQFAPGQVLTAAALNTAFANAQVTSGSIDGATIGVSNPAVGRFTSLYLTTPDAFGYNATLSSFSTMGTPNAALAFKSARGSAATPAASQGGDLLGTLDFYGYGTTGQAYAASLDVVASGTFTGLSWPTQLNFNATPAGSTTPQLAFSVNGNGVVTAANAFYSNGADASGYTFVAKSYNATGAGAGVQLLGARGNAAAPSATLANDILGALDFFGYGTSAVEGAAIDAIAGSQWAAGNAETYLAFFTTAQNSTLNGERMRINGAGRVLVGQTADNASDLVQVNGAVTSNARNAAGYNFNAKSYGTGLNAGVAMQSARGTSSAPAALLNGDLLGGTDYFGHNGTAMNYAASVDAVAIGDFTSGSTPAALNFNVANVGSTVPALVMQVIGNGVGSTGYFSSNNPTGGYNYYARSYSGGAVSPAAGIALQGARGTTLAASAVQAGDTLGAIDFYGHNGTAMGYAASIDAVAATNFSGTNYNSQLNFNTAAANGTTPITVMTVSTSAVVISASEKVASSITAAGQIYGAIAVNTNAGLVGSTLTAGQLVGGVIMRSGPTAAYTDTTDSAANIVAAIPNPQVGTAFRLRIVNTVAFADTIAAGAGVTLSGTTAIAASTYRDFVGIITNVGTPAVTLYGIGSGSL
jgi:hypothetical protein